MLRKKTIVHRTFLVILALAITACATPRASEPNTVALDELSRAIRDVSDYLNNNINDGSLLAFLNIQSESEGLSNFIIDDLIANAVNDRIFTVVDRHQLDVIRAEQNLQLSGDVDDETALGIGRFLGAQTIVSGRVSVFGGHFRLTIRALDVQTAQVQGQYNRNLGTERTIITLMGIGRGQVAQPAQPMRQVPAQLAPAATGQQAAQAPAQEFVPAQQPPPPPPIVGTIVPGGSLTDKLAWLQRSADSHGTYILEVRADENISPHTFEFRGGINITIVLRGDDANRNIRLRSNGTMFTVRPNVTLILDNNITLHGHSQNNNALVIVNGGILRMNTGATITGNTNPGGGAFQEERGGGGVRVTSGSFEMNGGTIGNNTSNSGGGVLVSLGGTFIMTNGTISGNTALRGGGGVFVFGQPGNGVGSFTMRGGIITGNIASSGGGVSMGVATGVSRASFTMSGGTITGNTATNSGGGVRASDHARISFTKTGGIITGYANDRVNGNVVRDSSGNVIARSGHAVFASENRRRETTAGTGVNLNNRAVGGWGS